MRLTREQVLAHQAKHGPRVQPSKGSAVERESKLRQQILDYCAAQWPTWLVISARTDTQSTIAVGAHDCTIFAPQKIFCLELKNRTGKLSQEQTVWAFQMGRLGHEVYVIRSMEEFLTIVKPINYE